MFQRSLVLAVVAALSVTLAACSDNKPPVQAKPAPAPVSQPATAAVGKDEAAGVTVVDPSKGPAINVSDEVGRKLMALYPDMQLISVEPVPETPLFEVQVAQWGAGKVGYTDKDVTYVYVNGDLYVGATGNIKNYTKDGANARAYNLLKQLPFDKALTFTYGAGARTLVIFEDPDCPLCHELEDQFKKAGPSLNMTVKILPFPLTKIHPQAEARARHMFCTTNPEGAWNEWMTNPQIRKDWNAFAAKHPADPTCDRAKAVDEVLAVADRLGLNQTPILMFDNGMTFNGLPSLEELEQSFQFVAQAKANGQGIQAPSAAPAAPIQPAAQPPAPAK